LGDEGDGGGSPAYPSQPNSTLPRPPSSPERPRSTVNRVGFYLAIGDNRPRFGTPESEVELDAASAGVISGCLQV